MLRTRFAKFLISCRFASSSFLTPMDGVPWVMLSASDVDSPNLTHTQITLAAQEEACHLSLTLQLFQWIVSAAQILHRRLTLRSQVWCWILGPRLPASVPMPGCRICSSAPPCLILLEEHPGGLLMSSKHCSWRDDADLPICGRLPVPGLIACCLEQAGSSPQRSSLWRPGAWARESPCWSPC